MLQKNNLLDIELEAEVAMIRESYTHLISPSPLRNIDAACTLGISEGALLNAFQVKKMPAKVDDFFTCMSDFLMSTNLPMVSIPLEKDWAGVLREIRDFGEVMALTRNSGAVHEKIGVYPVLQEEGNVGIFHGEIDLRIYFDHWAAGYFLIEKKQGKLFPSLQFFNKFGIAIHKIYFKENDLEIRLNLFLRKYVKYIAQKSYVDLISSRFETVDLSGFQPARHISLKPEIFKREWSSMRDTHDFSKLLQGFDLTRLEALQLVGSEFAQELELEAIEDVLRASAQERISIMVFVGNESALQIHTGLIHNIAKYSSWLNILDGSFNFHLREKLVSKVWLVRKPTVDGVITSIEVFDAKGEVITMIFGERQPGHPQKCDWIQLVNTLAQLDCYRVEAEL